MSRLLSLSRAPIMMTSGSIHPGSFPASGIDALGTGRCRDPHPYTSAKRMIGKITSRHACDEIFYFESTSLVENVNVPVV